MNKSLGKGSGREAVPGGGSRGLLGGLPVGGVGSGGAPRSGGERGEGGGSEPERSGAPPEPRAAQTPSPAVPPDPEVVAKPARRRMTAAYKLRILQEADALTERGQLGALLRREGLYSSHLISWRRQRDQGVLRALEPQKRGRKAHPVDPLARKVAELERDNRRLQKKLEKAELIIDFQKKVAAILGIPLNRLDDGEND